MWKECRYRWKQSFHNGFIRKPQQQGIKQAEKFYHYTQKHGYGQDQDNQMWKTLKNLQKPQK